MARKIARSAVVCLVVLALSAAAPQAPVSSAAPAVAPSASEVVASWRMNDPPRSTRMRDSSGHGHHGAISQQAAGAGLTTNGSYYTWAMRCPSCLPTALPRLVRVPDSPELDIPDTSVPWSLRFRFRTSRGNANVMQKGQATTDGGQIKVENPHGLMTCVFRGAGGKYVSVRGTKRTNDGNWHTVRCLHTATGVSQWVDGVRVATKSVTTGPIDNRKPFVIGGKQSCNQTSVSCDYFSGRITWVKITRG